MSMRSLSWLRRRFSSFEEDQGIWAHDSEPNIRLQGYRHRNLEENELNVRMTQSMITNPSRRSQSPIDVSLALSEDSNVTLTEMNDGFNANSYNATPVMRKRRSHHIRQRNYRILDPNESRLILQQQSSCENLDKIGRKSSATSILRKNSSKKPENNNNLQPPMVITPPMIAQPICSSCHKPSQSVSARTQSYPMATTSKEEDARLSFASSSTGYSSARSSLRSSDGSNDRDSAISVSSSSRLSALLSHKSALSQIDRIAIELLETERSYVDDLRAVVKGYMDYFIEEREKLRISLNDISCLFGCVERILLFNAHLFMQLDAAELDCVRISKCFVDNAGQFDDYVTYCTNYHRMMSTLHNLQQQPTVAKALSDRQAYLGHSLPLSAYLLKPVQRILKYHLFLENMLKNLPAGVAENEAEVVRSAHRVMTAQATRINEEKKKAEHLERVGQLQSTLHKWKADEVQVSNLSAYGDLLLEATFRQAGSKTNRLLFLFEEMLLIVKQRASSYICKDYIMCSNLMLNEWICRDEPLSFQVLSFDNPRAQYVFVASNMEQKRVWMKELKRAMLDHYAVEIPEKTKQLMLSIDNTKVVPFGRPEFADVGKCKKIPKYLEKRRKSVESRKRSNSASRLLGGAEHTCTCGLNPPSTSEEKMTPIRTQSSANIDLSKITPQTAPSSSAAASAASRSRYQQARNRRPPRHNLERSASMKREEEGEAVDIDKKFDELYDDLVSFSIDEVPAQNRSKSLTRLDEVPMQPQIERRYSKLDQMKRKSRKFETRQRTPLTSQQVEELDKLLPYPIKSCSVVSSNI